MGRVAERLLSTSPLNVAMPAVVLYELEVGLAKSNAPRKRRLQLDELVSFVDLLTFSAAEAKSSAAIRVELERMGTPIGPIDVLIAGTALSRGATLVTHNVHEFGRIKKLTIEDWY